MKRWNGWGDEAVKHPLPDAAAQFLEERVGPPQPVPDAPLAAVVGQVPESRLTHHPAISTDPAERLRHARGHSLPDWVALRRGRIGVFPDGVAYPTSGEDVRALIDYAAQTGARLIPYGGGTSVVGHINPLVGDAPVLSVDLSRMNRLLHLDERTRLATFGAGVNGPNLEAQLRAHGLTLGHYPQSFEYSTLGGWIATRSSGQQSLHYGRIERLFAGGTLDGLQCFACGVDGFPDRQRGQEVDQLGEIGWQRRNFRGFIGIRRAMKARGSVRQEVELDQQLAGYHALQPQLRAQATFNQLLDADSTALVAVPLGRFLTESDIDRDAQILIMALQPQHNILDIADAHATEIDWGAHAEARQ